MYSLGEAMALRIGPYELRWKVVRLRRKESPIYEPRKDEVVIYYFVNTQPRPAATHLIVENVRNRTIGDKQTAAAFVHFMGLDPLTAARIVATNKAVAEGLSPRQTAEVVLDLILHIIEQHPPVQEP